MFLEEKAIFLAIFLKNQQDIEISTFNWEVNNKMLNLSFAQV